MFFPRFSFSLVLFGCNCAKCKYGVAMIGPYDRASAGFRRFSWTFWAMQQLAIWMHSFADMVEFHAIIGDDQNITNF
jgi:hypothetical protein